MDDEDPAHAVGDAGQRAQDEIAGPADRLQDPEGAVLVLEERLVEADASAIGAAGDWIAGVSARHGPPRGPLLPLECRAVGRH